MATEVDVHDPAGMAAFMRERARCSREFLKLTSEEQIRQFMESWQRNVLPHFAFRFEQGAELIERLERERDEWSGTAAQRLRETQMALLERDCAVEEVKRLDGEVKRLMGFMPEHDTRESYRCTECGAFHLRHPDVGEKHG